MVDLSFLSCTTPSLRKVCHTCFGLFLESCDSMADFLAFLIRMFTSFLSAQYFSQSDVALVLLNLRNHLFLSFCNFFYGISRDRKKGKLWIDQAHYKE